MARSTATSPPTRRPPTPMQPRRWSNGRGVATTVDPVTAPIPVRLSASTSFSSVVVPPVRRVVRVRRHVLAAVDTDRCQVEPSGSPRRPVGSGSGTDARGRPGDA